VALGDAGINDQRQPILSTHMYHPSTQPGAPGVSVTATSIGRPNPRHPNKLVNVGFVDGHAEAMPMTPQSPFYPGEPGVWTGNSITDPRDPNYKDTLWDLN
jgi:prepilin-type processing-associated H-X9-DG protein